MSQEEDKSQKTQLPTEQKLQDLRKKGEVPRSNELNSAIALTLLCLLEFLFGGQALSQMAHAMSGFFQLWHHTAAINADMGPSVRNLTKNVVRLRMILILAAGMGVVVSVVAQRSFVVAPQKLKPKLSRISMLKNAKQKFGASGLFEFSKSLTKLIVFTLVLVAVTFGFQGQILGSNYGTAGRIVVFKFELVQRILLASAGVAMLLGAVDLLWQRQHFLKSHMMSRQDMRDELKRSEGDPDQKAERLRRGKEFSQNKMLLDVPKADVIVVNPTHYAVALNWKREQAGAAPVCVAKGADHLAAKIREIAQENGVPIFLDPPTARALHADVDIGQEIAFRHFQAVAAAIRFADQIRKKTKARL